MPKEMPVHRSDETDGNGCISPSGCLFAGNTDSSLDSEKRFVEVGCSGSICSENHMIHSECFDKWLSDLLKLLERDRSLHVRNHTVGKGKYLDRLVWTTNVYRHVFHQCKCPCGGYLKPVEKDVMPEEQPVVPSKPKTKALPKLNQPTAVIKNKFAPVPTYAESRKSIPLATVKEDVTSSLYAEVGKGTLPVGMAPKKKPTSNKILSKNAKKKKDDKDAVFEDFGEEGWQEIKRGGKKMTMQSRSEKHWAGQLDRFSQPTSGFQALPRSSSSGASTTSSEKDESSVGIDERTPALKNSQTATAEISAESGKFNSSLAKVSQFPAAPSQQTQQQGYPQPPKGIPDRATRRAYLTELGLGDLSLHDYHASALQWAEISGLFGAGSATGKLFTFS